jgi:hypothetical protein
LVTVGGILQDVSAYGVVGRTLNFSGIPPNGTNNISVRYLGLPASNVTTTAYRTVTDLTATAGQTTFSVASYTPGFIDVYRNGVKLAAGDFTASNGAQVVLASPAFVGDTIQTISFYVSSVANAIPGISGSIGSTYLDITGQSGVGAMTIPTGTTAQRPVTPANGMIRKNTTTGYVEYWDPTSSSWIGIGAFAASGGATSTYTIGPTTYKVHTFLSSDALSVFSGSKLVDYMIIGGGGGGGTLGGGGGAGGYLSGSITLSPGTYSVVIGGGANGGAPGTAGGTGGSTTAFSLTALGGGGGGSHTGGGTSVSGTSGGSGGGASDNNNSYSYGNGTVGQGNRGGNGSAVFSNIPRGGGGGGGASGVGADIGSGGAGGPGTLNAINGTSYYWAGGGGYGGYSGGSRGGDGGIGGGGGGSAANGASPAGAGGGSALNNGTAGTVGDNVIGGLGGQNTGGGGGGNGWSYNGTGGRSGGSGIVIIRYTV